MRGAPFLAFYAKEWDIKPGICTNGLGHGFSHAVKPPQKSSRADASPRGKIFPGELILDLLLFLWCNGRPWRSKDGRRHPLKVIQRFWALRVFALLHEVIRLPRIL